MSNRIWINIQSLWTLGARFHIIHRTAGSHIYRKQCSSIVGIAGIVLVVVSEGSIEIRESGGKNFVIARGIIVFFPSCLLCLTFLYFNQRSSSINITSVNGNSCTSRREVCRVFYSPLRVVILNFARYGEPNCWVKKKKTKGKKKQLINN